jgi:hypothetical protein
VLWLLLGLGLVLCLELGYSEVSVMIWGGLF